MNARLYRERALYRREYGWKAAVAKATLDDVVNAVNVGAEVDL